MSEAWFMLEKLREAGLGIEERTVHWPAGSYLEADWQWHWVKKQLMMWSSHRWPVLQPTIAGGTTILLSQLFLSSLSVLQQTDWGNQSNESVSFFLKRDSGTVVYLFSYLRPCSRYSQFITFCEHYEETLLLYESPSVLINPWHNANINIIL